MVVKLVVVSGTVVVSVVVASVVVAAIVSPASFVAGDVTGELVFFFQVTKVQPFFWAVFMELRFQCCG